MADREHQNRRKYARIDTDDMVSFAPVDLRERIAYGRDISLGGIRFQVVGCEIDPDEVLRVTFNVAGHTLVAVGRVAWATELDPLTTDVGIEFIEIDPMAARLLSEAMHPEAGTAA